LIRADEIEAVKQQALALPENRVPVFPAP